MTKETVSTKTANLKKMLELHEAYLESFMCGKRLDLTKKSIRHVDFSGRDLNRAIFVRANFPLGNFSLSDLTLTNFESANLGNCDFTFANFEKALLANAILRFSNMFGAIFYQTNLINADLTGANLACAQFYKSSIREANFLSTDLSKAVFYNVNFKNCNLINTKLRETSFIQCENLVDLGKHSNGDRFIAVLHDDGWHIISSVSFSHIEKVKEHFKKKKDIEALARIAILDALP